MCKCRLAVTPTLAIMLTFFFLIQIWLLLITGWPDDLSFSNAYKPLQVSRSTYTGISIEGVEYFRFLQFSWTKIAELIGISRSTLYWRLEQEGIDQTLSYSSISDRDFDETIESIKHSHLYDGERLIIGHLRQRGIVVQRYKIRALRHRVDPIGTAVQRSRAISRHVYQVEGPNSLWHIDGNHQLINWRFVVHGAIDGYSRSFVLAL